MTRTQAQISGNTAPHYEWNYTFYQCQNPAFTMGEDFRFHGEWDDITSAGDGFASGMFNSCSGAGFTMNDVFNLPPDITTVGNSFAYCMFSGCNGAGFTMNDGFNLPPLITTAGGYFAYAMFSGCYGAGFLVNGVFTFPILSTIPSGAFESTFSLGTNAKKVQTRTAESIINGNGTPDSDRNTFGPSSAWSDYSSINANWRN
jgi:hypothetical protein